MKFTYKNDRYDGPYESYYENGQLSEKCTYKDGKRNGPYESYYENGQLKKKCTYKDGKGDGPYELYYYNGQLSEKGTYKDGKRNGPYESYYENGQLKIKCTYKDDKEDGPYEDYDEDGKLIKKGTYVNGEFVSAEKVAKERQGLNAKLEAVNATMKPTALRQAAKRSLVAEYRKVYPKMSPKKSMGAKLAAAQTKTAPTKQSWIGKCFKMFQRDSGR